MEQTFKHFNKTILVMESVVNHFGQKRCIWHNSSYAVPSADCEWYIFYK